MGKFLIIFFAIFWVAGASFLFADEISIDKTSAKEYSSKKTMQFAQYYDAYKNRDSVEAAWFDPFYAEEKSSFLFKTIDTMYTSPDRYFLPRDAFLNGSESFIGFEVQIPFQSTYK